MKSMSLRLALLLPLLLAACSPDGQKKTNTTYTNDQSSQDTNAQGQDNNQNGIRDDIDALITEKYSATPVYKQAAVSFAQTLQVVATTMPTDAASAIQTMDNSLKKSYCVTLRAPDADQATAATRLVASTFNTKTRLANYEAFQKLVTGSAFTAPKDEECPQ